MASGSYARKSGVRGSAETQTLVPARATRQLGAETEVVERKTEVLPFKQNTKVLPKQRITEKPITARRPRIVIDEYRPDPVEKHRPWLNRLNISIVAGILFTIVLLSAAILQRPGDPQLVNYMGGQTYDVQVGGNALARTWQTPGPVPTKVAIPTQTGPYAVLGKPTITADFINKVLDNYGSPAAGKGQTLYDLGIKYGIDPAFALAFFMHESSFGTQGEARKTLSLGNLRCYPGAVCVDKDRGGYAAFRSWEEGFEEWYQLIRNLYVGTWGFVTVDQIITKYAPAADNNNESAYINFLKHAIDTWRAGEIKV